MPRQPRRLSVVGVGWISVTSSDGAGSCGATAVVIGRSTILDVTHASNRDTAQRSRAQEDDQRAEAVEVRQFDHHRLGLRRRDGSADVADPPQPGDARPTTNHAPPRTLIHPPSIAVARFRDISSNRPPTAVATPGNTCSQPRASVHVHAASGVDAKSKNVPTNGISAPHTPSTISRKPLIAPRLRGIPNRPPRVRIRVSVFMAQRIPQSTPV